MMKIDSKKTFDLVHWDFIIWLLNSLKFPTVFVSYIRSYITTPTFTLTLNRGKLLILWKGKRIKVKRPTVPLFFVLTMEYLSRLLEQARA